MRAPNTQSGPRFGKNASKAERLKVIEEYVSEKKKVRLKNNIFCFINIAIAVAWLHFGNTFGVVLHSIIFALHFLLAHLALMHIRIAKEVLKEEHDNPHWS